MRSLLLPLCLWFLSMAAHAVIETYEFSAPELEQRYQALSAELRCPKCQNQNIADSNAPIAQDLRRILYEQLEAGATDAEILDYMVARYGEFVRYRPAFSTATAVLWLAPLILLLLAAAVAAWVMRRGGKPGDDQLNDDDRAALDELLDEARHKQ